MMAVCRDDARTAAVRAGRVGTDSAGLAECDPLAYDRVELRQFQWSGVLRRMRDRAASMPMRSMVFIPLTLTVSVT